MVYRNIKKRIMLVAQIVFVATIFLFILGKNVKRHNLPDFQKPSYPSIKIYDVDTFIWKGDTLKGLSTEKIRWKELIVRSPSQAVVQYMDGAQIPISLASDSTHQRTKLGSGNNTYEFNYSALDSTHFVWSGVLATDSIKMKVTSRDSARYRLIGRSFHWIQEYP
jgi:hypothetical protein